MSVSVQISGFRPHQIELLRRTVAADCSRDEFDLFIETAQRSGLDPFRRQIVPLVFGKHNPTKRRMVVIVTLEGQRVIAHRCGNYRAASEPPDYTINRRRKSPVNPHGLVLARVTLWQQDKAGTWFPVSGEAYWDEFAPVVQDRREGVFGELLSSTPRLDPASPWSRMPHLMLAKCATAQALRAGWPEQFGGLYTEEEMERAKLLDFSPSELSDSHAEERRTAAAAGKDALTLCWDGWTYETVPLAGFAGTVAAWLQDESRTPSEVSDWAAANQRSLREFWGKRPDEALRLKRLIETQSAAMQPKADHPTDMHTEADPPASALIAGGQPAGNPLAGEPPAGRSGRSELPRDVSAPHQTAFQHQPGRLPTGDGAAESTAAEVPSWAANEPGRPSRSQKPHRVRRTRSLLESPAADHPSPSA